MQLWQALLLGALQGVSELFPVSSLAHTILIPALLNWNIDYGGTHFLAFVVALHLATAIALVIYFWKEWRAVILAYVGSFQRRQLVYDRPSKFAWLLVAGTIIAGLFGLVFQKPLERFFQDPKVFWISGALLVVNGGVMLYGDYLRNRVSVRQPALSVAASGASTEGSPQQAAWAVTAAGPTTRIINPLAREGARGLGNSKKVEDLTFMQAAGVGATQILALFPGISRSGVTIVGGLLAGLSHEEAARFAFMLATPIIGLAALLKVPELLKPDVRDLLGTAVISAVLAGVVAYLSVRFLMRYFQTEKLSPFGYYCIGFGLLSLVVLLVRH